MKVVKKEWNKKIKTEKTQYLLIPRMEKLNKYQQMRKKFIQNSNFLNIVQFVKDKAAYSFVVFSMIANQNSVKNVIALKKK